MKKKPVSDPVGPTASELAHLAAMIHPELALTDPKKAIQAASLLWLTANELAGSIQSAFDKGKPGDAWRVARSIPDFRRLIDAHIIEIGDTSEDSKALKWIQDKEGSNAKDKIKKLDTLVEQLNHYFPNDQYRPGYRVPVMALEVLLELRKQKRAKQERDRRNARS